jgi:ERCC4-type nuclease
MIRVVIDTRETELWALCAPYTDISGNEGWIAEKRNLDIGDISFYLCDISGAIVNPSVPLVTLERKRVDDLGSSQKDGRYREQRARLLASRGAGTSVGYIVEAPYWTPNLSNSWCRGTFTEVHLQQTLLRLQFRYTLPVFQVSSVDETMSFVRRIARMLAADPAVFRGGLAVTASAAAAVYTEAVHIKKADNKTPERIFVAILSVMPGLGGAAVTALAAATGHSMTRLLDMTAEEIAKVPNGKRTIGPSVAATVYAALHS